MNEMTETLKLMVRINWTIGNFQDRRRWIKEQKRDAPGVVASDRKTRR